MELSKLTEAGIETYLLEQGVIPANVVGKIPTNRLAPMFDQNREPILEADGAQLCLSYIHAALWNHHVLGEAGKLEARETQEAFDLPGVLFFRAADVHLLTPEGNIVIAMRGNASETLPGICLTAAAGFSEVVNGAFEGITACGLRELQEETSLTATDIGPVIELGYVTNAPIQRPIFEIDGVKLAGRVPNLVSQLAAQSYEPADVLLTKIATDATLLGMLVLSANQISRVLKADNETLDVRFAPATGLLRHMANHSGDGGSLADDLHDGMRLTDLRARLPEVLRPNEFADPAATNAQYKLDVPVAARVSCHDVATGGLDGLGRVKIIMLPWALEAAYQFGLVTRPAPGMTSATVTPHA